MSYYMPTNLQEHGLWVPLIKTKVFSRVALAKGEVAMFDLGLSDGAVTDNNADGGSNSGLANVVDPSAAAEQAGPVCVALQAIADNGEGEVMLVGIDQVMVHKATAGNLAAGTYLTLDVGVEANALEGDAVASTESKCCYGRLLDAVASPQTPALGRVWFIGLGGGHGIRATP